MSVNPSRQQSYYQRLQNDPERYKKYLEKKKKINKNCRLKKKEIILNDELLLKKKRNAEAERKRIQKKIGQKRNNGC